jgi:hypothetical protein
MFCYQQERLHRGLPFFGVVFGLRQLGDVDGGVAESRRSPFSLIGQQRWLVQHRRW